MMQSQMFKDIKSSTAAASGKKKGKQSIIKVGV